MNKISIITLLNTFNYGSVLQTYATQTFFEQLGYDVEFVDYVRKDQTVCNLIKKIIKSDRNSIVRWLKKPANDLFDIISIFKSRFVFRSFIQKNIHLTKAKYSCFEDILSNPPIADMYCTGSDQMWNTYWNQGVEKSFYLDYAPIGKKRISFATSIGNTSFNSMEIDYVIPLIKKYDLVTVREKSAEILLKKHEIDATTVLDPTLLFDINFWRKIANIKILKHPYLLVYQLHPKHKDAQFDKIVQEIAKDKNLEIVRVVYSKANRMFGKKEYLPSVNRFLSLILNADYIVTDSFHGTAFSINFEKQFTVVYPTQFSTRIDNLLKLTGLCSRRYIASAPKENYLNDINFDKSRQVLCCERDSVKNFFADVLKNNNWQ